MGLRQRLPGLVLARAERHHDVLGAGERAELREQLAALGAERKRRQRQLADDHRVHELDGDVTCVRAGAARATKREQPSPTREALGKRVAELRQPLAFGLEERPRGLAAYRDRIRDRRVGRGEVRDGAHPAAPTATRLCAQAVSHAAKESTPSPVRALSSMCSAPGCTARRW